MIPEERFDQIKADLAMMFASNPTEQEMLAFWDTLTEEERIAVLKLHESKPKSES
jgi:hypothetical protein